MKLTIEPTEDLDTYSTCSITFKNDDLNIRNVFNQLVIPALLGYGFTQATIDKYLNNEE